MPAGALSTAPSLWQYGVALFTRMDFEMRLIAVLACAVTLACSGAVSSHADPRVALIIGNSAYRNVSPLDNPTTDARLMAETLRSLGFTVVGGGAQLDLDKAGIDRAVQAFGARLQGAEVGLFYYAGHGLQIHGANYLVPVDANPTREADVDFQMLDSNLVLRQMEAAGTRLNLVILDACRNNPFGGRGLRDTSSGLAQMRAPEGTLISFATQPGNVAQDGVDGHSPFTRALADIIRRPGLGLFDTFNQVGLAVRQSTGGAQQPWVSSSPIAGSFYFAGPGGAPAPAPVPITRPPPVYVAPPTQATRDFIFQDSSQRIITGPELDRLSRAELDIARNEIFARRGRYFQRDDLKRRFSAFSWYRPNSWDPPLNPIERANVEAMRQAGARR
jgi:Caspase domain/YARHG domain